MKLEALTPLGAALIAGLVSIAGILYSHGAALRLERTKWEQGRLDEARRARANALADFTREFATAYQRAAYVIWQVEMMSDNLTADDFSAYSKETKAHLPKLMAAQVLLVAHDTALFHRVEPLLREYYALDERISVAGKQFRTNRTAGLAALAADVGKIKNFEARVTATIGATGQMAASTPN